MTEIKADYTVSPSQKLIQGRLIKRKNKTMKKEIYVRMNSRITKEQREFVKSFAKKGKMTEGMAYRFIIGSFINVNK